MTHVIGEPCIDVMDTACREECPVDAIYAGTRMMYINPDECINCGACLQVCPTQAIRAGRELPANWEPFRRAAADLFAGVGPTDGGSLMEHPLPDTALVSSGSASANNGG